MKKRGRKFKDYTKRLQIMLTPEMAEQLEEIAGLENKPIPDIVRSVLVGWIANHETINNAPAVDASQYAF